MIFLKFKLFDIIIPINVQILTAKRGNLVQPLTLDNCHEGKAVPPNWMNFRKITQVYFSSWRGALVGKSVITFACYVPWRPACLMLLIGQSRQPLYLSPATFTDKNSLLLSIFAKNIAIYHQLHSSITIHFQYLQKYCYLSSATYIDNNSLSLSIFAKILLSITSYIHW